MSAAHLPEEPSVNHVFETYVDEEAYEVPAASPHIAEYGALAKKAL